MTTNVGLAWIWTIGLTLVAVVPALSDSTGAVPAPAAAPGSPAVNTGQPLKAPASAMPPETEPREEPGAREITPRLRVLGFGDVMYHNGNRKGEQSAFRLGMLDLFLTERMSDRLSILLEAVVEPNEKNELGIEAERFLAQFTVNEHFRLAVGRYHAAIGYYNTAYHHGAWLETAAKRPFLFAFEDKGGPLPIHGVGLSASGSIPSGSLGLGYVFEVSNGRASHSPLAEPVQNFSDENSGKAVNIALIARPVSIQGLQAGLSLYHDVLTPDGAPRVDQQIWSAHVVIVTPTFEWLNEGILFRHHPNRGRQFNTPGFYTQVSRQWRRVRPFFRYQWINASDSEPVLTDVGLRYGPSLGVRYDVSDSAAAKLQFDHTTQRGRRGVNELTAQLAFTF